MRLWHPALYEHPVLPFRYKSGGPPFCSGMVEQDVRTRQDATLVSLLSISSRVAMGSFTFGSYVVRVSNSWPVVAMSIVGFECFLLYHSTILALELWSGRAERTHTRQRPWRPRVTSSELVVTTKQHETNARNKGKKEVRPMWHPALCEHTVLPFRYNTI